VEEKNEICHNWSRGNGFCKYEPNCNYKHEGPQGGKKRGADAAALLISGGSKKSRRKLVSLLVKDIRENLKEADAPRREVNNNREDDDDRIYELIRGAPTCIITRNVYGRKDLDGSPHSSDDDFDMANLAQPEKFETLKRIKDKDKTRKALALYPEPK
jgi:hypothetical protein